MTITKIPPAGLEDVATAGSAGSASQIPVITINSKGQVISLGVAALDLSTKANTGGSNATGTWPISISGNSNFANSAGSAGSAGSVPWTGVSGRPTALSEFTNNLGNYGSFLNGVFNNNCGGNTQGSPRLTSIERSGNSVYGQMNCNCNCNC